MNETEIEIVDILYRLKRLCDEISETTGELITEIQLTLNDLRKLETKLDQIEGEPL